MFSWTCVSACDLFHIRTSIRSVRQHKVVQRIVLPRTYRNPQSAVATAARGTGQVRRCSQGLVPTMAQAIHSIPIQTRRATIQLEGVVTSRGAQSNPSRVAPCTTQQRPRYQKASNSMHSVPHPMLQASIPPNSNRTLAALHRMPLASGREEHQAH